jgi:hypothetical protein
MGGVHDEAAHNLGACGYLVLDVYAGVGDGSRELGVGSFLHRGRISLAGPLLS